MIFKGADLDHTVLKSFVFYISGLNEVIFTISDSFNNHDLQLLQITIIKKEPLLVTITPTVLTLH